MFNLQQQDRKYILRQDIRYIYRQETSLPRVPEKTHDERRAIRKIKIIFLDFRNA